MLPKQASLIFFFVALIYGVVWTVVPFVCEPTFRYDTVEMFLIGNEGVIASFKHPALNSIVLEVVYQILFRNPITPYLLNQVFFFLTAFAIWRVGREFFTPFEAVVGVLTFYGYWAYFYASLNYNHNIFLTTAWSFVTLFALLAIKYNRYRDWLGLGVAIGFGFHCKISIAFLVVSILIFTIANPSTRKYWLRAGVYLTIITAAIIASPILYWMFASEFSFLEFPWRDRLDPTLTNRLYILFNTISILPLLLSSSIVLFLPLVQFNFRFNKKSDLDDSHILARNFLIGSVLIAWFLMLLSCIVSAMCRDLYDFTPLFVFTGLIFAAIFKTIQTPKAIKLFFIFFTSTMLLYLAGYSIHLYSAYNIRDDTWYLFPGKELSAEVEKAWINKSDEPLRYITGEWQFAGCVAIYSPSRPTCHCDYDGFPLTTWSTDEDVLSKGGVVIWEITGKDSAMPSRFRDRFPDAELVAPIELPRRTKADKTPHKIGLAVIHPNNSIKPKPPKPSPIRLWTN
ncbi:MAG: glycosyltransferase family 39 protein [Planctomycetaceae bacterium]|jgi:hypothetical protein|nr:glycosyltransferase family 39 protein [Planctomycetaceae bacterium]